MLRGKWILFAGVVLIGAGGVGALVWQARRAPVVKKAAPKVVELPKGAEVGLQGKIQAAQVIGVDAPLDGVMEEIAVKVGDDVYEGQILARIANAGLSEDEKESSVERERAATRLTGLETELTAARLEESRMAAELSRTRSEATRAERAYRRQEMLVREGATPRQTHEKAQKEWVAAQGEFEQAQALAAVATERIGRVVKDIELAKKAMEEKEAAYEAAKAKVEAANLLSPVDGLVVSIGKAAGDEVQQGTPGVIGVAVDLTRLEVGVDAPEAYTKRLAAGGEAIVMVEEMTGGGLAATVKTVERERFVVEFSSPSPLIRPGMSATVKVKLN